MTDITELAQREKFENLARSQQLSLAYGDCGYFYSSTEMAWRAVKALSAELVEALEKAQQRIDELLPSSGNMLMPALEGLSRDHLLVTTQTAVDNYSVLHTKWLKDRQRIAELESRTVKLPKLKMLEDYLAEVAIEERKQILVGVKLEFHRALAAAGIKVEAE